MPRRKPLRSPRFARKERRRRSKKIILLSIFVLMAAGWALYGLSRPEFRLREIEVLGSERVPDEEVRVRVREELSGTILGFIPKSHTLLYPKTALKASLLTEFPALSNVALSLQGLSSLRVFLHEREPQALWCVSPQECFLVDETGTLFARAEENEEDRYYHLEGKATEVSLGAEVIPRERLGDLLFFLRRLGDMSLLPERVLFRNQDELEIVLRGGMKLLVREGEYERARANLETLMAANNLSLKKDGSLSASYIDLRYGNKIYFKPR